MADRRSSMMLVALLIACLAIVSVAGSSIGLYISSRQLAAAKERSAETSAALAYACGYLAGQRGIIEGAKLPIPQPKDPDGCEKRREVARLHGFYQ